MKHGIVKVEVLLSLSLKNGASRSLLKGPFRGQSGQPRVPQKFEAISCLCFVKNHFAGFSIAKSFWVTSGSTETLNPLHVEVVISQ